MPDHIAAEAAACFVAMAMVQIFFCCWSSC